jgi:tetratricopeptide (TPR) repeat protein
MPRSYPVVGTLLLGFAMAVSGRGEETRDHDLVTVWSYAATSQPIEARAALKKIEGLDERTEQLANAVLDMARPPLSDGDWHRLEPVLARLAEGDDEIAAQALYLQARMHQVQKSAPDHARAEQLYGELSRRWPESHWTQLGYVKLGLTKLFVSAEPQEARVRLAEVEALLAKLTEPALRRDLQIQIAWAGLFYERPLDEVLPHLIAVESIGGMMGITPEDLLIQIGELSFRAGHPEQSVRYFERLLAEYPASLKSYNVRQRMAEVMAAGPTGGDAR